MRELKKTKKFSFSRKVEKTMNPRKEAVVTREAAGRSS